jgi:DNA transposition AAA+ family ATPase
MGQHASLLPYLKSLDLPPDAEMIRRVRSFLIESGLTTGEFAEAAGMNGSSFRVWLSGNYAGRKASKEVEQNTLMVRAKLKEYLDHFEEAHDDFMGRPHYATRDYAAARKAILDSLKEGVAYVVDGPPGTQKTHCARRIAQEINESGKGRAVYMRVRCQQAPQSFLSEIAIRAGLPARGHIDQLIRKLRFFLADRRTVLLIDEVQALSKEGLEIARQLLDEAPYFGVVLLGSHSVSVTLDDWRMEQWRSRVRKTLFFNGPSREEAEDILLTQLGKMSRADLKDTIDEAMTTTKRGGKDIRYISARALFDAINMHRAATATQGKPNLVSGGGAA